MAKTGVYPCYENQFKVGDAKEGATSIADMETFSVSFDNGVEEWTPFDTEGWVRRLLTAKGVTISVTGKRNVSDTVFRLDIPGWNYSFLGNGGNQCEKYRRWRFDGSRPSGVRCTEQRKAYH